MVRTFNTICWSCGTPFSCDKSLLNKKIKCLHCGKIFIAREKIIVWDSRQKILDQIIQKSEFIGQWEIYLNQFADKNNPKYQYWQQTFENLKKERKELYDKLLDMIKTETFKD